MSDARIPYGDDAGKTATLLLGAAEDLDLEVSVIRTQSDGFFLAPEEVAKKAGVDYTPSEEPVDQADLIQGDEADQSNPQWGEEPAKKTAAKKAAAKKTSSKG